MMTFPVLSDDSSQNDASIWNRQLYMLRLTPIYKQKLWGGDRLCRLLNRTISKSHSRIAESWDVCDHPHGFSVIENGPLRGKLLNDVVRHKPCGLFGANFVDSTEPPKRFPLIFKYLDVSHPLSIQIHPDDKFASEIGFDERGKLEAWIIVDAEPESFIWLGPKTSMPKAEIATLIRAGKFESFLHRIRVQSGDVFSLPPGTIHSAGPGILIAEIQTNSDMTFRLHDWNRLDETGHQRPLNIENGLRALPDIVPEITRCHPCDSVSAESVSLLHSPHFSLNRIIIDDSSILHSHNQCHILSVLSGSVRITASHNSSRHDDTKIQNEKLNRGDTLLIPAEIEAITIFRESDDGATLLDIVVEPPAFGEPPA
ncbi:MAG: type I phosphomannose isomerase catalytic subunit [Thermoguttaceae bacterium]